MKAEEDRKKGGRKPDPEVQARRHEVFDLVAKGWTTKQIAEHQGRKPYQVAKDIERGAKRMLNGDGVVKQYIYMQLARLEAMWAALCDDATNPRSKRRDSAVREAVKLFERQARLLGLDAKEAAEIMALRTGLDKGGSAIDLWLKERAEAGIPEGDDDLSEDEWLAKRGVVEEYEEEPTPEELRKRTEQALDTAFMAGAAAAVDPRTIDQEPELYDPADDDPARGVVEVEVPKAKNRRVKG